MSNIQEIFRELELKRKRSRWMFIFLNVLSFVLVAGLIVLNLFAIRFNPDAAPSGQKNDSEIIILFISLSVLSGVSSFFTSILSFFVFRKKAIKAKEQMASIKIEMDLYNKNDGAYKTQDKDILLIERITKIKNK